MLKHTSKQQFNYDDYLKNNNYKIDTHLGPNTNINKEKIPINKKKNEDDKQNININNIDKNNPKKELKENQNNKVNNNKNEPKDMISNNKNEKQNNILTPKAKDDSNNAVNEYINEILSTKKTILLTDSQYVSLENKIGENSCFINVIIHFLYIFPCVNDYLIRKYKKKVEKESKKNEENNNNNKKEPKDNEPKKDKKDNQEYVDENQINNIPNSNSNSNYISIKEKKEKEKIQNEKNRKIPNKKDKEFLYYLGEILNDYQNILLTNNNKQKITKLNTIKLRKSLSISSNNLFKLNSISDPIELLIYILDIINKKNFEEIHTYFHLKLIEEIRCTNFCPCKSNKKYDKDNFIYQIYVEEIFNYIKNHKLSFDEYKEKLFMLSYYSLQNEIITCEKCKSLMNKTLICNNEQGSPKLLLINCVWNNFKPEIQDVIKFLCLISLIEEIDNLFLCPNKIKKDYYYLMGIIFYSFTLCHYINMIFNLQQNVFTLYNDDAILEFKTINELYRYLTLEQIKSNNQAYFYPVLLVYGKENIYDENKIPLIKQINKIKYEILIEECKKEIKKDKPLTEEEKQKNYRDLVYAQMKAEREQEMKNLLSGNNKKSRDNLYDYYKGFNNDNDNNKLNIINNLNNNRKNNNNNFLRSNNNKKINKPSSVDHNKNIDINRGIYPNQNYMDDINKILGKNSYYKRNFNNNNLYLDRERIGTNLLHYKPNNFDHLY